PGRGPTPGTSRTWSARPTSPPATSRAKSGCPAGWCSAGRGCPWACPALTSSSCGRPTPPPSGPPAPPWTASTTDIFFLLIQQTAPCAWSWPGSPGRSVVCSVLFAQQAHGGQLGGGDGVPLHGVGGGACLLPGAVFDPGGAEGDAGPVGGQGLQGVPQGPLAPLLAEGHPVFPPVHRAHKLPLPDVGGGGGVLPGLVRPKVEPRRIGPVAGA